VQYFLMENLRIDNAVYGVYHPEYDAHVYRNVALHHVVSEPINRAHDDESTQLGVFTYDGLTLDDCQGGAQIQLTCTSPVTTAAGHFRNLTVTGPVRKNSPVVDLGQGPRLPKSELQNPVPYYFHDSSGDGHATKVMSTRFDAVKNDPSFQPVQGLTGGEVRGAKVEGVAFPKLLDPVDDLPPATVITSVRRDGEKLIVRGVSSDNGEVAKVEVNGVPAKLSSVVPGMTEWEARLPTTTITQITASAVDRSGNAEALSHQRVATAP
jgi:hypothetical protein